MLTMQICNFCGNKNFKEKTVQYIYRHHGQFLIVKNVPCEECEFYGEQYFKAETLKKIERNFQAIHFVGKKSKKAIR